ncbi:ABC transporter ATP-binding protein [Martelella sp. FOR1707]
MLEARRVRFGYGVSAPVVDGVDIAIRPGEIVGLTGRSGAGKSTLGRLLAGYHRPASGEVLVDGKTHAKGYNAVQYLHQSPIFAVDPRWTVGRIIAEGWTPDEETRQALGVSKSWYDRFPHEISGGELQRIAVLRALGPRTRYLVADEISAPLDPLTQAQIWDALIGAVRKRNLGMLVISHNRPLLARLSGRVVTL